MTVFPAALLDQQSVVPTYHRRVPVYPFLDLVAWAPMGPMVQSAATGDY